MEAGVIVSAIAGLLAGAGAAAWVVMNAPRMAGHLTLFSAAAVFILPVLVSFRARDQIIESAVSGGVDELQTRAFTTIFTLCAPLGVLSISMFKDVGRRMQALVAMGILGAPAYLVFTTSMTAATMFAGAI